MQINKLRHIKIDTKKKIKKLILWNRGWEREEGEDKGDPKQVLEMEAKSLGYAWKKYLKGKGRHRYFTIIIYQYELINKSFQLNQHWRWMTPRRNWWVYLGTGRYLKASKHFQSLVSLPLPLLICILVKPYLVSWQLALRTLKRVCYLLS